MIFITGRRYLILKAGCCRKQFLKPCSIEERHTRESMEQIRAFDQNEFLQKLWNNYNPGPGLEKPDFSSVLVQIYRFIGPVYGALLQEEEFFGMWSSKENEWR